jgi:ribosomal protein L7/L12
MTDFLAWCALVVLLALMGIVQQLSSELSRKIIRLDLKIDKVMGQLGIAPESAVPPEVAGLLQAARKIEAIKVYRDATGASLKAAKDAIDDLEARRIITP